MNCAYDESYLPLAQSLLGDMYDYAVNTLRMDLTEYQQLFLISPVSGQIEHGNPHYIAGKNGCEVAREVIEDCTGEVIHKEDLMYLDKSPEYWIGWSIAYYQWLRSVSFREIEEILPLEEMMGMYPTLHEADVTVFVEVADERLQKRGQRSRLKRLRAYAQLSQRALAEQAEVPLRQIQLFEQGQRDICRTQGQTLNQLAKALHCRIEDLLDS